MLWRWRQAGDQALEVRLVVPRPHRRSQQGAVGDVAQYDALLGQSHPLRERVAACEGDERGGRARDGLAAGGKAWAEKEADDRLAAAASSLDDIGVPAEVRGEFLAIAEFITARQW